MEENNQEKEVFLQEHEELVHLYTHEDTVGFNLVYFNIVTNVAITSAIGLLSSNFKPLDSIEKVIIFVICLVGFIIGICWFFIMFRNNAYRNSCVFKGVVIEKKLDKMGYNLDTFRSCEEAIKKYKKVLSEYDGQERDLRFYEKVPTFC